MSLSRRTKAGVGLPGQFQGYVLVQRYFVISIFYDLYSSAGISDLVDDPMAITAQMSLSFVAKSQSLFLISENLSDLSVIFISCLPIFLLSDHFISSPVIQLSIHSA